MPDDSQTRTPLSPPLTHPVRLRDELRRPRVRDVFFITLSPAVLTVLWSGYDTDRTSPWWLVFLLPFSVALLKGLYGALNRLFGNARAGLWDGLRSIGSDEERS